LQEGGFEIGAAFSVISPQLSVHPAHQQGCVGVFFHSWLIANGAEDEEPGTAPSPVEHIALVLAHETIHGTADGGALHIGRIPGLIGEAGNTPEIDPDDLSGELGMILARESAGDGLLDMSETSAHGLSVAEKLICCSI